VGFSTKIADFSLAVMNGSVDFICESPYFSWPQVSYIAPEALTGITYSSTMDVWSIGVLLYMMVTNSLPFSSAVDAELLDRIIHGHYSYGVDTNVPTSLRYFINQFLVVWQDGRISLKDAMRNPWIIHKD